MALLLFGFAFDAAQFVGVAVPHWPLVAVACMLLPLIALGGLSPLRAGVRPRVVLVFGGCVGTWALAVYEVAFAFVTLGGFASLDKGGFLAGVTLSAAAIALAAFVQARRRPTYSAVR